MHAGMVSYSGNWAANAVHTSVFYCPKIVLPAVLWQLLVAVQDSMAHILTCHHIATLRCIHQGSHSSVRSDLHHFVVYTGTYVGREAKFGAQE